MLTSTVPPTPPVPPASRAAEPSARVRVPGHNIELDLAMVRSKFNMRIEDAATDIGIPLSALKIACRQLGIARWPRRVKPRRNVPVAGSQSAQARDPAPAGRQDSNPPLSSGSSGEDSPRSVPMQAASPAGGIAFSSDRSIVSRWSRVNVQTGGLLDWALDELGDSKVETRRGGSLPGSAIPRVTEGRAPQDPVLASSDLKLLLALARRYPIGASGTGAAEIARKGGSGPGGGASAAMQHGEHDEGEKRCLHRSGETPQTSSGSASFRLPHRQLSQALAVFTTDEFASDMASAFHY
jgi:hypothetical protein